MQKARVVGRGIVRCLFEIDENFTSFRPSVFVLDCCMRTLIRMRMIDDGVEDGWMD